MNVAHLVGQNSRVAKSAQNHDIGYKHLLSNWRMFKKFMTSFIDEKWVNDVDYEHLELVNRSFILKEFRKRESDLLYKARLKSGDEFYFYILLEHQSTVDHGMPFRLLIYITELWREELKARKDEKIKTGGRLPAVFPIVLYNGERRWTAPTRLRGLIDGYELFRGYVPDFRYALVDASHFNEKKLREIRNAIAGVFLLDRETKDEDLRDRLREVLGFLEGEDRQTISTVAMWMRYMLIGRSGEATAKEAFEEWETAYGNIKEARAMIETLGERLVEQGIEQGMEQGMERGMEQGMERGMERGMEQGAERERRALASKLLSEGMPASRAAKLTGLSTTTVYRLRKA